MTSKQLTEQDYIDAARMIGCEVAAIKAVAEVESGGRVGFDDAGRLLMRFEGHHFRKNTKNKFDKTNPYVSYAYHKTHKNCGQRHGYKAFNEAFGLDRSAAMWSSSIGMFQVMGFNHGDLGYATVGEMYDDFKKGEREQLFAFVRLIKKWDIAKYLRTPTLENFGAFAKRYNGADFKANKYDTKMLAAYKRYSKQKPTTPASAPAETPDAPAQINEIGEIKAENVVINNEDPAENLPSIDAAVNTIQQQMPRISKARRWLGTLGLGGIFSTTWAAANGLPAWQVFMLGFLTGILLTALSILLIRNQSYVFGVVKQVLNINADPTSPTVNLISRAESGK